MDFLIHRLTWEIVASNQEEATNAQRDVSALMQNPNFLGKLEESLKRIISNNDLIELDRLELDIGQLTSSQWAKQLENELLEVIVDELTQRIKHKKVKGQEKKEMKQYISELFFDFVRTGVLPPSTPTRINTLNDWGDWLAEAWQSEGLANEFKKRLKNDEGLFHALVQWPLLPIFKPLRQIVGRASSRIKLFAEIDTFITKLGSGYVQEIATFRKIAWTFLLDDSIAHDITIQAAQDVLMDLSYEVPQGKVKKLQEHIDTLKRTIASTQYSQAKKKELDELLKPLPKKEKASGIEEKLYVKNAGLVICAPFLPTFFINSGLGNKKEIYEPELAISLVSFLVNGNDKEVPADLALPKVLCGIPLNEPIVPISPLAPKMKREAEALLVELIEHWKVLKNTSPNGLREGFLQREGILETAEDGLHLHVESKAQDALIAQLPWSIGIIKLPWMNKPLHVEWA